ncbi:hypothetical protein K469DRAFT_689281 [Zopfia rhizophila CBS 207.26]|uniref:Uncharacterized protein n=1 Tax=Zopfia rhizophila CBS 207.26 TaxID=1314779 RepID=A0A6A6EU32_9PEZI|nr:hypothetical protein K469DRAFT_689281 [Zopfia rhizophila CBS 207.26]
MPSHPERSYITTAYPSVVEFEYGAAFMYEPTFTTICNETWHRAVGHKATAHLEISRTSTRYNVTSTKSWMPPKPTYTVPFYDYIYSKIYSAESSIIDRIISASFTTDWPGDDLERISAVLSPPCSTTGRLPSRAITPAPTPVGLVTPRYGDLAATSPTMYYIIDDLQMQIFIGAKRTFSTTWSSIFMNLGTAVSGITMEYNPRETPFVSVHEN